MKKIALLSGAYINAGDFLIEKRCVELLSNLIADSEVSVLKRNENFSDRIDFLNSFDGIVFGGGPYYLSDIYQTQIPFVDELKKIKTKILFMGGGGFSLEASDFLKPNYFSTKTKMLFEKTSLPLGCRDWQSLNFLSTQNFNNTLMTGCPAWYEQKHLNNVNLQNHLNKKMKITVSECAYDENVDLLRDLIVFLRGKYQDAEISLVIHRGIRPLIQEVIDSWLCKNLDINIVDITGSAEGFSIYDNSDLHVGFRVHAHLYNLSIRNKSVLINEDFRGFAMNETLGLNQIEIDRLNFKKVRLYKNLYAMKQISGQNDETRRNTIKKINFALHEMEETEGLRIKKAFETMRFYYNNMQKHIRMFNEVL